MSKKILLPKNIIGLKEWCNLECLGLPAIKGKVDTGAKTSSLHAFNIENFFVDDVEYVRFDIHPLQKNKKLVRTCEAKVIDQRLVSDSSGRKEKRFVIKSELRIGKYKAKIELTLANRDSMSFKMLIGREAIKQLRMLVDISKSFLLGKNKKSQILQFYK